MDGILGEHLRVTSKSANGWLSDAASWDIYYDTTPTVASGVYPENGSGQVYATTNSGIQLSPHYYYFIVN